ncbi:MAG: hypothetical protein ABJQ23_11655 [Shimia thalassica]|uniref:hypothetical protein n=1 Tax=Shimia thalassica TaxID=1715693 RepID=UPI0032976BC3
MRRLWIHIGHDKTGSSYLQALFARNLDVLASQGIGYPIRTGLKDLATRGITTSGTEHDDGLEARIEALPENQDVLLSYEGFFNSLAEQFDTEMERWRSWCTRFGFDEIHVLLFIRNPIGHATSSYMQIVRAHGGVNPLDAYVRKYNRPLITMRVLKRLQSQKEIASITVRNYSRVRNAVADEVLAWLPVEADVAFHESKDEVINRGLTDAEMIVTRWVNGWSPAFGRKLAIQAQRSYPDLQASRIWPSFDAQQNMLRRNKDAMGVVNQMAGPLGSYEIDTQPPHEEKTSRAKVWGTGLRMFVSLGGARVTALARKILP